MRNLMRQLIAGVCLAMCTGCGTIMHRCGNFAPPEPTVYPAVHVDAGMLTCGMDELSGSPVEKSLVAAGFILDFPFSLLFDTICLPYDLWRRWTFDGYPGKREQE